MKKRFYNFARDADGRRELYIEGDIADSLWFGDECTPAAFRKELFAAKGDITLWINSYGGECVAASQIYTLLMDYPYDVIVKIPGMAASAASVIAMAGTKVLMSPTAMMLIHNPWTIAIGEKADMERAGLLLDEVKESILNAYEIKTGLSRVKLSHLMNEEKAMSVHTAIALGFCDGVLEASVPQGADNFANMAGMAGNTAHGHNHGASMAGHSHCANISAQSNSLQMPPAQTAQQITSEQSAQQSAHLPPSTEDEAPMPLDPADIGRRSVDALYRRLELLS